jgi:hypothetical protein
MESIASQAFYHGERSYSLSIVHLFTFFDSADRLRLSFLICREPVALFLFLAILSRSTIDNCPSMWNVENIQMITNKFSSSLDDLSNSTLSFIHLWQVIHSYGIEISQAAHNLSSEPIRPEKWWPCFPRHHRTLFWISEAGPISHGHLSSGDIKSCVDGNWGYIAPIISSSDISRFCSAWKTMFRRDISSSTRSNSQIIFPARVDLTDEGLL